MAAKSDIKVGDVVAWEAVPDGALVRSDASTGWTWWYFRRADSGDTVGIRHSGSTVFWPARVTVLWNGWSPDDHQVTIIALNVPADATADDLRALAERFEVREALSHLAPTPSWYDVMWDASERAERCGMVCDDDKCRGSLTCTTLLGSLADDLHAAGWRPGMTAEDAARLLREAGAK